MQEERLETFSCRPSETCRSGRKDSSSPEDVPTDLETWKDEPEEPGKTMSFPGRWPCLSNRAGSRQLLMLVLSFGGYRIHLLEIRSLSLPAVKIIIKT